MNREEQLDFLINYLIDERNEAIEIPQDYKAKRDLLRSLMNVRIPLKISDKFLKVQDDFLTAETLAKDLTSVEDIKDVNGKILLWQGDIVTLKVDGIVNAANSKLLGCFIPLHNCIDNMIHSAAGVQLRDECNSMMQLQGHDEEVGKAKITNAYNLPSKYVIHTVGPAIPYGSKPSKSVLKWNSISSPVHLPDEPKKLTRITGVCLSILTLIDDTLLSRAALLTDINSYRCSP